MVKAADLKPGAIVLDVGVSRVDDGTGKAVVTGRRATPTRPTSPPGSRRTRAAWVPMTRAMLLANVVETAERHAGIA